MRNKIIATCTLAVLAVASLNAASPACDKDKTGTEQPAVVKVQSQSACSKQVTEVRQACSKTGSDKARAVVADVSTTCSERSGLPAAVLAGASSGCSSSKAARAVVVSAGEASCDVACSEARTVKLLARAMVESRRCGSECAARKSLVAAVRALAEDNPRLVCNTLISALTIPDSDVRLVAAANDGRCSGCCAAPARVRQVAGQEKACDVTACGGAREAAVTASACQTAGARFIAFGCEKTDRIARAAARAYVNLIRELKMTTGGEGCHAEAASKVLASVLQEMSPNRATAESSDDEAEAQATPVSLGALTDDDAKPACGGGN